MPPEHFMRDDIIGVVLGTLLFAPLLLGPGYVCGWLMNAFGFRQQARGWRAVIALPLSIGIAPIVTFLLGTFLSMHAVWAFYGVAVLASIGLEFAQSRPRLKLERWVICTTLAWALVVCASGIDLQFGNRLYPPVFAYDLNLRTEIVQSLATNGLPAVNPLFHPGHAVPLRYHYFWYLGCALVDIAGGEFVNARQALIASDVWCGWGLMAITALFLRYFHPTGERNLQTRMKWGIGLLAVTGLDLLPNAFYDFAHWIAGGWFVYSSGEWWNEPFTSFPHAAFFLAHHTAALLACLIGFLLLWHGTGFARAVGAGLCFGSAAGLSVYVTFTFAIFLTVWSCIVLFRSGWQAMLPWAAAGVVAIACAAPYLHSLGAAGGGGGSFAHFAVRGFAPLDTILPAFGASTIAVRLSDLAALPINYVLEMGIWFFLVIILWKRLKRRTVNNATLAAAVMFAASLLVGTFLRSGTITNNDLGWRSILFAQFILLVWCVDPIRAWRRMRSRHVLASALLILGLASTIYDFVWMRAYLPMSDAGMVPIAKWFPGSGRLTFSVREIYEQLAHFEPTNAVVQENPDRWNDVYMGLYGQRQTGAFDQECGVAMGGDPKDCTRMQAELTPLFNDPKASKSLDIDKICSEWGISVLIAKADDPVFRDLDSWPWNRPTLASNEGARAVFCGTRREDAHRR